MNSFFKQCSESLYEDEEFDQHQRELAALLVSKVIAQLCYSSQYIFPLFASHLILCG